MLVIRLDTDNAYTPNVVLYRLPELTPTSPYVQYPFFTVTQEPRQKQRRSLRSVPFTDTQVAVIGKARRARDTVTPDTSG
jgi:hypothetical protein